MRSRLLSEDGVNGPTTIDADFQAILFEECKEGGDVLLNHTCSLAAVLKR